MRPSQRLAFGFSLASALVLAGAASCGDDEPVFAPPATVSTGGGNLPGSCTNGAKDGDESDVDCGGSCDPCDDGKSCENAADCASGFCDTATGSGGSGGAGAGGDARGVGGDGSGGEGIGGLGIGGFGLGGAGGEASGGDSAGGNSAGGSSGGATAGVCAPCGGHEDCAGGTATECAGGVCVEPTKSVGDGCIHDGQCKSGHCPDQDGICCESACDGECVSCLASKTGGDNGSCSAVSAASDPDAECSLTAPETCGAIGAGCNGDSEAPGCNVYPEGTLCGPATCSAGMASETQICDGQGSCTAGASTACDPYSCDDAGAACAAICLNDSHCVATHYCGPGGACLPRQADGQACAAPNQCLSGFCPGQDGVCCATACGGVCESCVAAKSGGTDGTCGAIPSGQDPDAECPLLQSCNGSGMCAL